MRTIIDWSQKRQKHVLERMILRGISRAEFHEALAKGRKRIQRDKLIEAVYRYYSIVYEEIPYKDGKKIYPVTVKVVK